MNEQWKMNRAVQSIDPKKIEIMELLVNQCRGKNLEDILPDLMAASSRLAEQGIAFTNEETGIIIDALSETMTGQEKQRLEMLRNMILKFRILLKSIRKFIFINYSSYLILSTRESFCSFLLINADRMICSIRRMPAITRISAIGK